MAPLAPMSKTTANVTAGEGILKQTRYEDQACWRRFAVVVVKVEGGVVEVGARLGRQTRYTTIENRQ